MREGERSDNIYVVVDSSKIVRCKWCGIKESESWLHSQRGFYCSMACVYAESSQGYTQGCVICYVICSILLIMTAAMYTATAPFGLLILLFTATVLMAMSGLIMLYTDKKGMAHRRAVPKGSRANDVSLDTALLATVSTSVVCSRCDAELDLRSIGKDGAYACSYCGATGTISVIDKSKQRGSGSGGSS